MGIVLDQLPKGLLNLLETLLSFLPFGGIACKPVGMPGLRRLAVGLANLRLRGRPGAEAERLRFDMGSDGRADAAPRHTVSVGAFYLAKTPMTQGQWKMLMGRKPELLPGGEVPAGRSVPVEQVSWKDCQAMLAAVNRRRSGPAGPAAADRSGMGICGETRRERDVRSERGALVCVAAGEFADGADGDDHVPGHRWLTPRRRAGAAGQGAAARGRRRIQGPRAVRGAVRERQAVGAGWGEGER